MFIKANRGSLVKAREKNRIGSFDVELQGRKIFGAKECGFNLLCN